MSEAITEGQESEATIWELSEGEGESEAATEAFGSDAYREASPEGVGDDARRMRQRQIMLARRQAQLGRPAARPPVMAPPRTVTAGPTASQAARAASQAVRAVSDDVLTLDLDTKAALRRLRRELDKANGMAYQNAWVAELNTNASQILDSFHGSLDGHDWAKALIRGLPNLALAPGNPGNKRGLERILLDPRFGGSVLLAGIFALGHFRIGSPDGVYDVNISSTAITVSDAGPPVTLSAFAIDRKGKSLSDTVTWASQDTTIASVNPVTGPSTQVSGIVGQTGQQTWVTASVGEITKWVWVSVSD
jgi:hypothetical protein